MITARSPNPAWEPLLRLHGIHARSDPSTEVNPSYPAEEHLTASGSAWVWTVTAVYIVVLLAFMGWSMFLKHGTRLYHQLAILQHRAPTYPPRPPFPLSRVFQFYLAVILPSLYRLLPPSHPNSPLTPQMIMAIGSVCYFLCASNLGWVAIATEFSHYVPKGTLRQVWYARWVDYTLTMPMLVLEFFFITGLCTSDIVIGCFMAAAWPACFLVGMLIRSTYKWPFFTFGCCFIIYLWYVLLGPGRSSAARMGRDFHTVYLIAACWYCLMTIIYPIAWGCCEGGNTISTSSEFVWYGIIDLCLKPLGLIVFLIMIGRLDLSKLQFYAGKYTDQNLGYPPHVHPSGAAVENAGRPIEEPRDRIVAVDNPPRQPKGKFFSRKGAHDATTNEKTPAATAAAAATAPAATPHDRHHREPEVTVGTEPTHTHSTKTRTVVHGHSADGEPRLSEATVVSDSEGRYP